MANGIYNLLCSERHKTRLPLAVKDMKLHVLAKAKSKREEEKI